VDENLIRDLVIRYNLLPVGRRDNCFLFAAENTDDTELRRGIEFILGTKVEFVYRTKEEIEKGLKRLYGDDRLYGVVGDSIEDEHIEDKMPTEIVSELLFKAVRLRASDIHFESSLYGLKTRFRIDGLLQKGPVISNELRNAIVNHIKILADLDISEKRRPQDGKFNFTYEGRKIDVRVSTVPSVHGEKVVLRKKKKKSLNLSLSSLGFLKEQEELFKKYLNLRQGIILVTGPTGSGKTTTLYAVLNYLNREEVNIMTVEDPVEYELDGLNQTQVHPQIGYTFANALRSFLRQDPDIILVGEIRDVETAKMAIRASLTGHLVFSTLHTNSTVDTIARLIDMDVPSYLLAATLKLIVAQRLIRKICPICKNGKEAKKCSKCSGTGYYGRVGIFEMLPITYDVQEAIKKQLPKKEVYEIIKDMGIFTFEKVIEYYIKNGITTRSEVDRVFSEDL